jgi:EAL domain-containing protein (putative c-di-GMP-specific phosphodiesterase class I)
VALPSWVSPDRSRARRAAASGDAVRVVLQPIVDLASGAVVAAEALARFPNLDGQSVAERFAVAHAAGRGADLEAACLRAALRRRADLPAAVWLSVNVSPDALSHPGVQRALAGDLDRVIVEVTEAPATDPALTLRLLAELRERGALIAVDDASTGYAGLLRLSRLRPDIVKLDAGLVSGAADSVEQSAVIEALVSLSRRIGARVLGEGVETIDDLKALVDLDVDYAQGWVFAHPSDELAAPSPVAVAACIAARRALMRGHVSAADARLDLHQVTAALAGSIDGDDLSASLRRAATSLGVDVIGLSVLARGELREIARADNAIDRSSYPLAEYPATRDALTTGRMIEIHLDDPNADPAERALLGTHGFASLLIAPLIRRGAPLGILEFNHHTARRWTSHDIRQAHTLADHVIHALLRLTETPEPHSAAAAIDKIETLPNDTPPMETQPSATHARARPRQLPPAAADDPSPAIGICDENGRFVTVSPNLARMLQRPPADILGRPYLFFVHPDQRATSLAGYFDSVTAAGNGSPPITRYCDLRCLTPTDAPLWVSAAWTVLEPDQSGSQFAIIHLTDITAARQADAASSPTTTGCPQPRPTPASAVMSTAR